MTKTRLTDRQVEHLADFVMLGRPDWHKLGIVAELRRQRDHHDAWQLAAAMIRRAGDPRNLTPKLQPHDHEPKPVGCRTHPGAAVRADGLCAACVVDQRVVDQRVVARIGEPSMRDRMPMPEQARAAFEALFGPAGRGRHRNPSPAIPQAAPNTTP